MFLISLTDPNSNKAYALVLVSLSFLLRMYKAGQILLKRSVKIGDNDVSRKMFSIILMAFIIMYIAAGSFMVIENLEKPICD